MSIHFEFYPTPKPTAEESGNRYHARVVNFNTLGTDELVYRIKERSALTEGDVKSALSNLSNVLGEALLQGERVHLEGIGYFHISLSSPADTNPKRTRAQSVRVKSVTFRADKTLKGFVSNAHTVRSVYKNHSGKISADEIDKRLTSFFTGNNMMIRRDFQKICGMTRTTALRHIKRLIEEGKIRNVNYRNQPIYIPVAGHYGTPSDDTQAE